jgi:diaminopimelate epimerase
VTPYRLPFVKWHGTGNDFVLIADYEGKRPLTAELVRRICDRNLGVGADGVIRVVRGGVDPDLPWATGADFGMDHRNADGSTAEMCGNGARVFLAFLAREGLVGAEPVAFATRGGLRRGRVMAGPGGATSGTTAHGASYRVAIYMGPATPGPTVTAQVSGRSFAATGVFLPNPHAVVVVDDIRQAGDLVAAPEVLPTTAFPDGTNVEFVQVLAPGHLTMRVHERGVGETKACGTGACAAAWVHGWAPGSAMHEAPTEVVVDQPGGSVTITRENGPGARDATDLELVLTGPAVLVADGEIDLAAIGMV